MNKKKIFWVILLQVVIGPFALLVGGMIGGIVSILYTNCIVNPCFGVEKIIESLIMGLFGWAAVWGAIVGIGKLTKTPGSRIGATIGAGIGVILVVVMTDSDLLALPALFLVQVGYYSPVIFKRRELKTP